MKPSRNAAWRSADVPCVNESGTTWPPMMQAQVGGNFAGIDVHKKVLVITALLEQPDGSLKKQLLETSTMTDDLRDCARRLVELGVRSVAMESTGNRSGGCFGKRGF